MSDDEDFENYEDFEEKPQQKSNRKPPPKARIPASKQLKEDPPAQPAVSTQKYEEMRENLYGQKERAKDDKEELNIESTGPGTYRLSSLNYASNLDYFRNMEKYVNLYDGTYHIKEFEKNCSFQQLDYKTLISDCKNNEKEKLKRMNKAKKEKLAEVDMKDELEAPEFNTRRDLNGENPDLNLKEALQESNPLNGYEFYDNFFKQFCNQLDQNTEETFINDPFEAPKKLEKGPPSLHFGRDNRTSSNRKQSMNYATPNNGPQGFNANNPFELFKSPVYQSPRSNHFDSMHSFNNDSVGKNRLNSYISREDSDLAATAAGGPGTEKESFAGNARKTEAMQILLKNEKAILLKFKKLLEFKQKAGQIKFNPNSVLNKANSVSSKVAIFKYTSLSYSDDISEMMAGMGMLGKRFEKEVILDFRGDPRASLPKKLRSSSDYAYRNLDLVYSSWYDALLNKIHGEEDKEMKRLLLIDLNDRSVFYSKLHSLLNEKPEAEEPLPAQPDLNLTQQPHNKIIEKIINGMKKKLRIQIAEEKGGLDTEEKPKEEMEEEYKIITMFNRPNLNLKTSQIAKLNSKKVRKITNYHHSEVATSFQFNIFRMPKEKIKYLHRYDIFRSIQAEIALGRPPAKWRVKILNNNDANYPLKNQLSRRRQGIAEINTQEIHHSMEIFKSFSKLSLKADDFFLFEYIEQNPLILSNVGMGSRLTKYYYPYKITKKIVEELSLDSEEKDKISQFRTYIKDKFGEHGEDNPLEEHEHLPILGQLVGNKYEGVTILENNLYRVPVFKQKTRKNDFVLVRVVQKGEIKYYLRRIKTAYTVGQIQPKAEVFCPYSRQFRFFHKKLLKFCINRSFDEKRSVHLRELTEIFPKMNDHNLRKNIRMLGGEQDQVDNKLYLFNADLLEENKNNHLADEVEAFLFPEELCLYERMYQTFYDLTDFGINNLKSSDKISVIKTKFYRNNLDSPEKCAIARRIIQELMLSSWNLSQSFLSAIQTQGRMYLTGYGDPTNGHGGMNFIKLPLKISRYESQLFRKAKKGKPNQMVTGTNADLRKLNMEFVHETLKKHGFPEDNLADLQRWDKIELLRKISNKQQGDNKDVDLDKFKREIRMTTKMQKEKYQNDINELLMTLIKNLSVQNWDEIESDDEMDTTENMEDLIRAEEKEINKYRNLNAEDEEDEEELSDRDQDEEEEETQSKIITENIDTRIEF